MMMEAVEKDPNFCEQATYEDFGLARWDLLQLIMIKVQVSGQAEHLPNGYERFGRCTQIYWVRGPS